MKSWIRRFALLAVMGSIVGGIVMAGCSSSEAPEDNTAAPAETAPPADAPAPPADAPAPPAPPAP